MCVYVRVDMYLWLCVCASECGTVCFCVWRYCVCESRPLAAAELSLIQLCLLSCLLAALSPSSALVLPQFPPTAPFIQPPDPASGPTSGSQSLLLGCVLYPCL